MMKTGKFVLEKEGNTCFQRRYLVTFVCFLCALVTQCHRVCISFAIVAMVNTTVTQQSSGNISMTDCGVPFLKTEEFTSTKTPEFNWNPEIQGYVLASGYLGYILTQLLGGYVIQRHGVKKVLFTCLLCASVYTLVSPVAARIHPYLLAIVHLLRGMCQGPPTAAFALITARWFPIQERGFLSSLLYLGFPLGGFVGSVISGPISEINLDGGWPLIFYTFGIMGILVSILILCGFSETPADDSNISEKELQYIEENTKIDAVQERPPIPWKAIMTSTATYAFFISLFGQYWSVFYLLTIHPIYMDTILHIPVKENGLLTSGPQLTQAISVFCTCWLSIWVKRKNVLNVKLMRKGYNSMSCLLYVLGMMGLYIAGCDTTLNEVLLLVVAGSVGLSFAGVLIVAPDMTPTFCGLLMGLGSTIASLSGFILPVLIGQLTKEEQTIAQWHKMFVITASIIAVSGIVFVIFGDVDIQSYDPAYSKKEAQTKDVKEKDIVITKF